MNEVSLVPGTKALVTWEANAKGAGSVKSNRFGETQLKKIVLPDTTGLTVVPKAGQRWLCEVVREVNPGSTAKGALIVRPLSHQIDCTFNDVWIDPEMAQLMSVVLQHPERNVFLEGPQGVGKTTISRALSGRLEWEFRQIEGSQIKRYAHMFGRNQQRNLNGQLCFHWEDSPLVQVVKEAIATPDKVFLVMIDEYTRIDEDARDILLPMIEGGVRLLQTPKPETLILPPNMRWIAAGNTGEGFTVKEQDDANTSRWVVFELNYMPFEVELKHCLRKYPNCPAEVMDKALKIVHSLRKITGTKMCLSKAVCTRCTESIAMFLSEGVSIEKAMLTAVANQFGGRSAVATSARARVGQKIKDALAGKDIEKD